MEEFVKVDQIKDFTQGEMQAVEVNGEEILIANCNGRLCAVSDICTHAEASLSEGILSDDKVECPIHGAIFSLVDGRVIQGPAMENLRCYTVEIREGEVFLSLG